MVDVAKISLFGRTMGYVRWDAKYDAAVFEYDSDFANAGIEPSPILMPVRRGRTYQFTDLNRGTFKGLPGLLADSLPDTYGRALFDKWLALTGRTSGNSIETLCFLGKRCMGAMEFEPAMGDEPSDGPLVIDSLVDVACEALSQKEEFYTDLSKDEKAAIIDILHLGTSAGGQRAKAIIAYNPTTKEVRSGQINAPEGFEYCIIKLDGVNANAELKETQNFGRLEFSFSKLVKSCGIDMTNCDLIEENGRAHFITKRFDRRNGGKVHMLTLCGIAHYDYGQLHAYSYEQAFQVMRQLRLPYSDAEEMFRRMTLNVVMRNQDDHTKNISFLMDPDGKWRLSPAYDMSYAYNPAGAWTSQHQMSVNGKYDNINRDDLMECARRNNIKNPKEIIDSIIDATAHWREIAHQCDVPDDMINGIEPNFMLDI